MEKTAEKKLAAGLSFMGRPLGELLELKASCRKRLEFLDANRGRISEYVYNKLRQEYIVYLDAVDGEVALGLSEYEIKLAEIRLFANQLKLLEKSYREKLEELSLRHSLGEFDQERYESLCADHEAKMKRFAGSLEKYQGQKKQIETFLAQARIERSLLDDDSPSQDARPAPEPETAPRSEPRPVQDAEGPPKSSLLELESTFSEPDESETAVSRPEPEAAIAQQAVETGAPSAETAELDDLPGLSEPPEQALELKAEEQSILDETLPEAPVVEEEAANEEAADEESALVNSLADELPEFPANSQDVPVEDGSDLSTDEPEQSAAESLDEELPATPGAPWESSAAVEPEQPVVEQEPPAADSRQEMQTAGAAPPWEQAVSPEPERSLEDELPEQPDMSESAQEETAGDTNDSGFDLEHIFGQAEQPAEIKPEQEELDREETSQVDETARPEVAQSQPEPELPETPGSAQQPAGITLEDSLLNDLSEPAQPEAEGSAREGDTSSVDDDGLDLDDIIDQSGAAGPAAKPQPGTPPVFWEPEPEPDATEPAAQEQQVNREISELERDLDREIERAATAKPAFEPLVEDAVDEPPTAEPPASEFEPEATLEPDPEPDEAGGAPSLVSLALQRASQEKDETEEPEQEDVVEFDLTGDAGDSDVEVRLTMNQTIDAIKKKTVKCPECGTMNYAIRWYCENCEATLTAL